METKKAKTSKPKTKTTDKAQKTDSVPENDSDASSKSRVALPRLIEIASAPSIDEKTANLVLKHIDDFNADEILELYSMNDFWLRDLGYYQDGIFVDGGDSDNLTKIEIELRSKISAEIKNKINMLYNAFEEIY